MRIDLPYEGLHLDSDDLLASLYRQKNEQKETIQYHIGQHVHLSSNEGSKVEGVLKDINREELIIGRKRRAHPINSLKGVLINRDDLNKPYLEVTR